ncbi:SDR family NAD(P)-dependent oxidoreductase [Roseobacter sinensis]|uniref:SDR family oxidoreductase n=1 Tax=Roseobacter sinensis TaxID=2931391 RepID=A0ABT3BFR8_9RHOB|nr:SDR family oxidoreductase [Roseobacter sp. WL0113]MCV3272431.1 SDR family oxidoreductase [Roseobacter sp. WL0113]
MTQTALITGASHGLGAALAEALGETHHIIAVAKTTGALEELDDRIKAKGGSATLAPMDITKPEAMATLCRGIFDRWGHLDLWLHTAVHAAPLAPTDHIDAKDFSKSIATNVTATSTLITYVGPLLGQAGQAVFFDHPTAGEKFFGSYGATKAAQIALARSWQAETAKTGPTIHIMTPDAMPTATRARFHPGEDRGSLADPHGQAACILAELAASSG